MAEADGPTHPLDDEAVANVLARARELGFDGFGGACGEAAIAMNRVLFDGAGKLVGAFNEPFLDHGRMIGHVAVLHDGAYWDADGQPKELDDIDSWGMLDPHDEDHVEEAARLGFAWSEDAACAVAMVEFDDEAEVIGPFGEGRIEDMVEMLGRAAREILGKTASPAR